MKTARLILSFAASVAFAVTSYAPDFGILLGGGSDDQESQAADHKDWIEIQSIAWTAGAAKDGAAGTVATPSSPERAKTVARRQFEPVVLTVPAGAENPTLKKAFTKGRALGTIRLRDGARILVLHGVTVGSVTRTGDTETVSLNYTKIENANAPERAKARIKVGKTGAAPN
jgi:type VI protein secretion system component Hcp